MCVFCTQDEVVPQLPPPPAVLLAFAGVHQEMPVPAAPASAGAVGLREAGASVSPIQLPHFLWGQGTAADKNIMKGLIQ